MQSPTHYDVLGVKNDASKEEITKAYRRAMRIAHPDATGTNDSPLAIIVGQAYDVLRDPEKRSRYDQALKKTENNSSVNPTPEWGVEDEWVEEEIFTEPAVAEEGYPAPQPEPYFAHTNPVDLSKVSWLHNLKDLPTTVYSPGKRSIVNLLLSSVLGLTLYIGFPQWLADDTNMRIIFGAFQVLGFLLLLPFAFGAQGKNGWVGFTLSGLALAGFFAIPAESLSMGIYFTATTLSMAWAALGWRKWRVGRGAGTEEVIALEQVRDQLVFGDPGIGLYSAMNYFGAENVAKGVHGERMTAALLEHILALPGARVIHGLRFPGSQKADVDHAIICGNRVAFIDSKYWKGGHWSWDAPGVVVNHRVPDGRGYPRQTHFQNAVTSFQKSLKGMDVKGWILIHPNDAYVIHTDNTKANGQPRLVDSQQALNEIGEWLLAGQPSTVDRRHMATLLKIRY